MFHVYIPRKRQRLRKPNQFRALFALLIISIWWLNHDIYVEAVSPFGNYAPGNVHCPGGELVRVADGLSEGESQYMENRRQKEIHGHLVEFFKRTDIPGFDYESFFRPRHGPNHKPTLGIGMAISGGGVRAMLIGAGGMAALDNRTPGSNQPGHLGGLLQSMSYVSGLSGGAWLIGSSCLNNMPPITEMINGRGPWNLEINPLLGEVLEKAAAVQFHDALMESIKQGTDISDATSLDQELEEHTEEHDDSSLTDHSMSEAPTELGITTKYNLYRRSSITNPDKIKTNGVKTNILLNFPPTERIGKYYETLYNEIQPKQLAGFDLSITDFWARALANVFLGTQYWPEMSWSDIIYTPQFQSYKMPYPILISNALIPKTIPDANTSTIIEMGPHEIGSWGPTLGAFVKTRYVGTPLLAGIPIGTGSDKCIQGFDNSAFIIATSSSLFNDLTAMGMKHLDGYPQLRRILTKYRALLKMLNLQGANIKRGLDYALYSPNPFEGFHEGVVLPSPAEINAGTAKLDALGNMKEIGNAYTNSKILHLVDGGEDDLNVPLDPLLRPERGMDLVIAVDASIDKGSHPNGTALYRHTWRYHGNEHLHRISFPSIPTSEEIVKEKYYTRPTFHGCNLDAYPNSHMFGGSLSIDAMSEPGLPKPPVIVYMPNHEISFDSQQSTTRLIYNSADVSSMIQNGYNMFTQSNSTEWVTCLGCAMIHREIVRRGEVFPEHCQDCFDVHCIS